MATNELKMIFVFQNETKGAVRYGELLPSGKVAQAPNDPGARVGTIYFRKNEFGTTTYPEKMSVIATF